MNEYPKQEGWYWHKHYPDDSYAPVNVLRWNESDPESNFYFIKEDGNRKSVNDTWPQEWGPKIEEPKK
jgi:hypothetical protein